MISSLLVANRSERGGPANLDGALVGRARAVTLSHTTVTANYTLTH